MRANEYNPRRLFEERLADVLQGRGWSVQRPPSNAPGADLIVEQGGKRYAVELKVASQPRLLQALLADSVLQARRYALYLQADPLAVVAAPYISESMAAGLRRYVEEVAPGQAFGYLDGRGLVHFAGRGLDGEWGPVPDRLARLQSHYADAHSVLQPRSLFSDVNQWLLKVLLGQKLSPEYISIPRGGFRSPSHLAKAASVSLPTASRFVKRLSEEEFLDRGAPGLEVVRVLELLDRWKAATQSPPKQVSMAWALRSGKSLDHLKGALQAIRSNSPEHDACLGLFSACEALGVGFVRGAPVHLYVREYGPALMEQLELLPAGPNRPADVHVRVPRPRESVFRARVKRDGVWVADALQTWLDVSNEASRGAEQADFLWRRVLAPQLQIDDRPAP